MLTAHLILSEVQRYGPCLEELTLEDEQNQLHLLLYNKYSFHCVLFKFSETQRIWASRQVAQHFFTDFHITQFRMKELSKHAWLYAVWQISLLGTIGPNCSYFLFKVSNHFWKLSNFMLISSGGERMNFWMGSQARTDA